MARWMTAYEISARYAVGEKTLLAYARMGNMPMLRDAGGAVYFDEAHAASLFPQRSSSGRANLGVMGEARLGASSPPASTRQPRHSPRQNRSMAS